MSRKLYFHHEDDERCYTIEEHMDQMKFNGEAERKIIRAKAEYGVDYFWCSWIGECGEKGECGKLNCSYYSPRNGISGICKHHSPCYHPTDEELILTIEQ